MKEGNRVSSKGPCDKAFKTWTLLQIRWNVVAGVVARRDSL